MLPELPPLPEGYERRMPRYQEEAALILAGTDRAERPAQLSPETAEAWDAMRLAALNEGVELLLVSAFRSYSYQEEILRRKLERGIPWEEILKVSAFPGFSEHHTGRAIDIGSPSAPDLEEEFDRTAEFRWLMGHASAFGFKLSYPRDNPCGIIYEPWHWARLSSSS